MMFSTTLKSVTTTSMYPGEEETLPDSPLSIILPSRKRKMLNYYYNYL